LKKPSKSPLKHPRELPERDLRAIRGGDDAVSSVVPVFTTVSNVLKTRHDSIRDVLNG
jgi:hypothetical protein